MEYSDFVSELSLTPETLAEQGVDGFLLFCFEHLFGADQDPAALFLAAAAAHSFSKQNWISGTKIAHTSCRIRFPQPGRQCTPKPKF